MPFVDIPFGKGKLSIDLPAYRINGILATKLKDYVSKDSERDQVEAALQNPIDSPRLSKLAEGKNKIVVITSDHTRPMPSRITLPMLFREIRAGNPEASITILVATGFHRRTTREELVGKFGEDIVGTEHIEIHDAFDANAMVGIGRLSSGDDLRINRIAAEADLLLSEGLIEAHVFAGYSGGRKSVLPGVSAMASVMANHCAENIAHPKARSGVLRGNPIHEEMLQAARMAGLKYILNVVLDEDKKIIKAVSGNPETAHAEGCSFLERLVRVEAVESDIVITSNGGYPLDQNVYQHVKALSTAEAACRDGGVIIASAELSDGPGSDDMMHRLSEGIEKAATEIANRGRMETVPDQWAIQIMARILSRRNVIFIADESKHEMLRHMHFETAGSLDEAMRKAEGIVGADASITIIPDGAAAIAHR